MILVKHLMNLLLSELEVQDELLSLLIRERVAIAKQSAEEMDAVLQQREEIEKKLERLVSRRDNLLRALETEMHLSPGDLSLERLALVEEGELSMLGESLSSSFATIFEMRDQNKTLRRQTLVHAH